METIFKLYGEVDGWPTKSRMASILRRAGLAVTVGRYAIRLRAYSYFVFEQFGGDLGDPCIDADADSLDEMVEAARRVSAALAAAHVRHRFELYEESDDSVAIGSVLIGYFHHGWPQEAAN